MSTNSPQYPTPLADFMVELFHFYQSQPNDTAPHETFPAPEPKFEIDPDLLGEAHSIAATIVQAYRNRCSWIDLSYV